MRKRWIVLVGAVALAAAGCGKNDEVATSQVGYRDSNTIQNASTRSIESKPDAKPAVSGSQLTAEEMHASPVSAEPGNDMQVAGSTAPDLLAKAAKEVVSRGETIDISAQGSSDVVEMILSDGYGTTQSLQFDAASNSWKTAYRVPLNMKLERLGLSVKAKNGDERWRRVWVFLNLPENTEKAVPESSAVTDSVED